MNYLRIKIRNDQIYFLVRNHKNKGWIEVKDLIVKPYIWLGHLELNQISYEGLNREVLVFRDKLG